MTRADRSSVTFSGAFKAAQKFGVANDTPIYAVFFSGLQKVSRVQRKLAHPCANCLCSSPCKSVSQPVTPTIRSIDSLLELLVRSTLSYQSLQLPSTTKISLPAPPSLKFTPRVKRLPRLTPSAIRRWLCWRFSWEKCALGHEKRVK